MSTNQEIIQTQEIQKQNDKEYNFAQLRKQAESERQARLEAERRISELEKVVQSKQVPQDDDYSDEPYVDQKFLNKKLSNFEKTIEQKIEERAEMKARFLLDEERRNQYLQQNNDFHNVMSEQNIQEFASRHPAVAKSILSMPDGFERQKLVYETIRALGVDKPKPKEPSIQEKIDANRRSPYYQPSGQAAAPYSNASDFSPSGQQNAYNKMQELKRQLRL